MVLEGPSEKAVFQGVLEKAVQDKLVMLALVKEAKLGVASPEIPDKLVLRGLVGKPIQEALRVRVAKAGPVRVAPVMAEQVVRLERLASLEQGATPVREELVRRALKKRSRRPARMRGRIVVLFRTAAVA